LSWQTDLLATWETGKVQHKTLLTVDYQRQTEKPERWDMTNFTLGMPAEVQSGLRVDTPELRLRDPAENRSLYALNQKENNSIDLYGVFLSERMIFLDGRANVMAGARYDYVDNHSKDLVARQQRAPGPTRSATSSAPTTGCCPRLTAFTNFSRSFVPQFRIGRTLDGTTFELPNEFGEGFEVGSSPASSTTSSPSPPPTTTSSAPTSPAISPTPPPASSITVLSGKRGLAGLRVRLQLGRHARAAVLRRLRLQRHRGRQQRPGPPPRRVRRSAARPRTTSASAPSGSASRARLKGVYATAGYKYYGRSIANPSTGRSLARLTAANPVINRPMPNGLLPFPTSSPQRRLTSPVGTTRADDGRESIYNDGYDVVEAGLGYKLAHGRGRYSHKIQVNAPTSSTSATPTAPPARAPGARTSSPTI
jgi:hypothetical protein